MIHNFKKCLSFCLLSQRVPSNPFKHVQVNVLKPSVHEAPLKQGLTSHSSSSATMFTIQYEVTSHYKGPMSKLTLTQHSCITTLTVASKEIQTVDTVTIEAWVRLTFINARWKPKKA